MTVSMDAWAQARSKTTTQAEAAMLHMTCGSCGDVFAEGPLPC
jgi:hypothetical protein